MTLAITFYDNIKYGRLDFLNRDKDFFGNGVVNLTDFPVTFPTTPNMNVNVGAGAAWVDGYRVTNSGPIVVLPVQPAHATLGRIDIIQIGHDDINSLPVLQVKQGVASGSPVEPGADPSFLKLYAITVAAAATQISAVTDKRAAVPLNVSATQISFGGAASLGANTFTGAQTAPEFNNGTSNASVSTVKAVVLETDTRSIVPTYTSGQLTKVEEKDGATVIKTTTLTYNAISGKLETVTEVSGGTTVTTTITYDGSGVLTNISKVVT